MKSKKIYTKVLGLALAALTFTACSDTWDEHYEGLADGVQEGSLWQAIKSDPELSNFASVLEACGFDKSLASSQVFTVFAPTNASFSAEEAASLIADYNAEKDKVSEEDNTVIKEFVKNHVAMYNHSTAPGVVDSLLLMNGKRLTFTQENIGLTPILDGSANTHYENGVLFKLGSMIDYEPNVFEYLRKDPELDSLRSFLYNSHFYYKDFQDELSVPGGIVDGKTIYLDSVFSQVNELYYSNFLNARLSSEDSIYWMVSPTNTLWKQLVEEYETYFNYTATTVKRDSFAYTFPRLAIMKGAIFSKTQNRESALRDSAYSTSAVEGDRRESRWDIPFLRYYQYGDGTGESNHKPLQSGGVLADTRDVECSNGIVKKADKWNIDPLNTFKKIIRVAVNRSNIQEMSKMKSPTSNDSVESVEPTQLDVSPDSPYYNKIWGNKFMQFKTKISTGDVSVTFNITDVLSNMPYDIYLVAAPVLANDSNATSVQRLPTKFTATLNYLDADGKRQSTELVKKQPVQKDIIDYVLLTTAEKFPEGFSFPCCTFGLNESTPQVNIKIATDVTNLEFRRGTFNRTMNIAYILLVPHGASWVDEENFYVRPHGEADGETFTMSKCTDLIIE